MSASPGRKGRRHARTGPADYVIVLLLTLIGAWVAWTSVQYVRAEGHSMRARHRIDGWLTGKSWQLPEWVETHDALKAAVAITPTNATLHDYLAALHLLRGSQVWADETLREAYYSQAREHQLRALELRPVHGSGWAALAQAEYALAPCGSSQWEAWRKALYYAPYEPPVQMALADLSLACTGRDPEDVQAWLLEHHAQATPRVRKQLEAAAKRRGVDRFPQASSAQASRAK